LLSQEEFRGRFGWRIEIQPEEISNVANNYYGRTNIAEDFVESSTEFALLWLGQYSGLARQGFDHHTAKQVINRPGAMEWLEWHYGREVDEEWLK
jgi:hypothetical protein